MRKRVLAAILASSCATAALYAPAASAQPAQSEHRDYDIAEQPLGDALREYARISGVEVVAAASVLEDRRSAPVRGQFPAEAALSRLLSGTGLTVARVEGALVLQVADGRVADALAPAAETIVVTGTRIRGSGPVGSAVITVDREALDRSGRATLADFIRTIPQNFSGGPAEANVGTTARGNATSNIGFGTAINLRGLGAGSTLTLIDGARPALGGASGAFADVSLIPTAAIDRIEILMDGASAIYGSDAVAGVVNIRLRNRFEGAETRLRAGTADGDFGIYQASQILGTGWDGGHLVLAGEYYQRGSLPSHKRAFATEDLRIFGGPDLRSNYSNPGTIVAANGEVFRIPNGQDGTGLTAAELVPGGFNRGDTRRKIDILPSQKTTSFYGSGEQHLGGGISLFVRSLYAERRFEARRRVLGVPPLTVTPSNPYYVDPIGAGQNITVYYDPVADFGPEGVEGEVQAFNAAFGARAESGRWSLELSGGYGLQREGYEAVNLVHLLRLARAAAASEPAQAINPFGDGPVNDPALTDSLRGSLDVRTRYEVWTGALRADGPLFALPAGEMKLALGAEYRRDQLAYSQTLDVVSDAPLTVGIPGLPDKRVVRAIYGELVVPVFDADERFPGALTLSAAGRYEDYSDVGDTANPKFGARWTPAPGLALRATYGHSFRAPSFDQLVGTANARYQTLRLDDPASSTGQSVVLGLFGFRPDLGPEKATSWSAGVDLQPSALPGARLSLTYFDIRYRDRIASPNPFLREILAEREIYDALIDAPPEANVVQAYFADPSFSNPLGVTPAQVTAIVDARTRNLSRATVRGLDFDLHYSRTVRGGTINLSLGGTRLFEIDNRIVDTAPANNVVGTLGHPVKLRLRGQLGGTIGAFSGGVGVQHVSAYRNLTVTPAERVESWTTVDLRLGARIGLPEDRSLRLAISVNNLLDRDPPYAQFRTINSALGYDPEQASPIGRTISLQAVIAW